MKIIETNLNWKHTNFTKNNPNKVILHHALSNFCSIYDIHQWHLERGFIGCGYHFFIRKTGKIYRGRKLEWNGAHCTGQNNKSVGVCVEGCYTDYKNLTEKTITSELLASTVELLKFLNLPLYYHRDFTDSKDCPGKYFYSKSDLNKYVEAGIIQFNFVELIKEVSPNWNQVWLKHFSANKNLNWSGLFAAIDKYYKD